MKIKEWIKRHQQLILYLIFGVITTVVSLGACYVTLKIGVKFWHDENGDPLKSLDILGSTVQWVSGVLVAFFTNKRYVFRDAPKGTRNGVHQLLVFSGSRVITYFVEVFINLGAILLLEAVAYKEFSVPLILFSFTVSARVWAKVISSVVVVISNYFISKLIVFRKRKEGDGEAS